MIELRIGCPDDPLAAVPHPQAEIHIVKSHRKRLVQAAQRIPHVGTDQQAGPGHSGQILHRACTEHIAPAAPALILMAVACIAPQSGDDTGVLDGIVRVVEHCASCRRPIRAGTLAQQLGEPIPVDDLYVIVQQ